MEYTFDNIQNIIDKNSLKGYSCVVEEKPLPILQELFDDMKKEYIRARNVVTEMYIEDYGEEEGMQIMNERYPKPVNIDELANQAKIIASKYSLCGTTLIGKNPGFIIKIPNVRVRVRTYCNLGDYYCWIQKFGIDKFILKIYQAMPNEEGYLIFGGATYPHPHIAGDSPCLGSYESVIKNSAGHFNMVGVLSNIKTYLNSYYGRSVYLRHGEFRPVKINTLPIELLKKYPAVNLNWNDYWNNAFKDNPKLAPDPTSDAYIECNDAWNENYWSNKEVIELKPHESNYYISTYNWAADCSPYYSEMAQKVRLIAHKFDIEYYQAYALLMFHAKQMNGSDVRFGSKYADHKQAWGEIQAICVHMEGLQFRLGYGEGLRLRPDESLNEAGALESRAFELFKLIHPGDNDSIYKIRAMRCNDFWKYIDNFKDVEEFLIPQDDYDERRTEVINQIDNLYPDVMAYKDAFSRKILITIDKQRRRLQNGLKHTIPTPDAHQLSFETLSKD